MKVKIEVLRSNGTGELLPGPSETTSAELKALQIFCEAQLPFVHHLVASIHLVQGANGPLPGGYMTLKIMTTMLGRTLWDLKFWSLDAAERDEIRELFWEQLQQVRALDISPYDCALRNIMWDRVRRRCSIIDFEHWRPCEAAPDPYPAAEKERKLQRWGLVQRPPPASWAQEWGLVK